MVNSTEIQPGNSRLKASSLSIRQPRVDEERGGGRVGDATRARPCRCSQIVVSKAGTVDSLVSSLQPWLAG